MDVLAGHGRVAPQFGQKWNRNGANNRKRGRWRTAIVLGTGSKEGTSLPDSLSAACREIEKEIRMRQIHKPDERSRRSRRCGSGGCASSGCRQRSGSAIRAHRPSSSGHCSRHAASRGSEKDKPIATSDKRGGRLPKPPEKVDGFPSGRLELDTPCKLPAKRTSNRRSGLLGISRRTLSDPIACIRSSGWPSAIWQVGDTPDAEIGKRQPRDPP